LVCLYRGLPSSQPGIVSLGNTLPLGFPLQFGHLIQPGAVNGATPSNVTLPGLASSVSSLPSSTGESGGGLTGESRVWNTPLENTAAPQQRIVPDLQSLQIAAHEKAEQDRLHAEQERIARAEQERIARAEQERIARAEQEQAERLRLAQEQHQAELQRLQEERRKQEVEMQRIAEERRKLEELRLQEQKRLEEEHRQAQELMRRKKEEEARLQQEQMEWQRQEELVKRVENQKRRAAEEKRIAEQRDAMKVKPVCHCCH